MEEIWLELPDLAVMRPLLILDVSAAAEKSWPFVQGMMQGLVKFLGKTALPDVCFLGSTVVQPFATFLANIDSLYHANRRRGRVIGPLFHALGSNSERRVVIVAFGPIIDLSDWRGTPIADRAFYAQGKPQANLTFGVYPEFPLNTPEELSERVSNPLREIRIGGAGAIALEWDNGEYIWYPDSLCSHSDGGKGVRATFLVSEGVVPRGDVTYADGTWMRVALRPYSPPAAPMWKEFAGQEAAILDQWRGGREWICVCGAKLAPGRRHCDGCRPRRSLLPSLDGFAAGTIVRLKITTFDAQFQIIRGPILRTASEEIAVAEGAGGVQLFRFDPTAHAWLHTSGGWSPFQSLKDGFYGMVL